MLQFDLIGYHKPLTGNDIDLKIEYTINGVPQTDIVTTLLISSGTTIVNGDDLCKVLTTYENTFNNIKNRGYF